MKNKRYCCHLDCDKKQADFEISWSGGPDDFTDSCEVHLGAMVGHHPDQAPPHHYVVRPLN